MTGALVLPTSGHAIPDAIGEHLLVAARQAAAMIHVALIGHVEIGPEQQAENEQHQKRIDVNGDVFQHGQHLVTRYACNG